MVNGRIKIRGGRSWKSLKVKTRSLCLDAGCNGSQWRDVKSSVTCLTLREVDDFAWFCIFYCLGFNFDGTLNWAQKINLA